jgi:hypothetical protein
MEQGGDHRARILARPELTDQLLACRTEFWRRTGRPRAARAVKPPSGASSTKSSVRLTDSSREQGSPVRFGPTRRHRGERQGCGDAA